MHHYFFVDESGDPTFFDARGRLLLEKNRCSPILIIGFIKTDDPSKIRKEIMRLHREISEDEYLKAVPSLNKTNLHFHAKDDCPEVREKFFKLIKKMDFKAQFVVARKRVEIFNKRHKRSEDIFYNEIVTKLFERNLHQKNNIIFFSKRGSKTKLSHFQQAIQTAILNFETRHQIKVETDTETHVQIPSHEICLQVIDYMNWALYRAYTKNEMRYFDFIKEKVSFVYDIYDFEKYPKNFYNRKNVFDISKASVMENLGNKKSPSGLESF